MKKILLFLVAVVVFASCSQVEKVETEPVDIWNGYGHLKCSERTQKLRSGNQEVGTVKYGIDENANFYATYDCSSSNYKLSKTNMHAGKKKEMPKNKCNDKRENRFGKKGSHNSSSTYTYRIPLVDLPPCEYPGFVIAAHAKLCDNDGNEITAWGEGGHQYCDKGKGWFDSFYYNQEDNQFTILYGTELANDSLYVYMIDVTNNSSTLIYTEYVGNADGTYDGSAFDTENNLYYFANYDTQELMFISLSDEGSSQSAGTLEGVAASATFYEGNYYYVDENTNEIIEVALNSDNQIISETTISTIPGSVAITDIAMDPAGENLYMVGNVNDGTSEMIAWNAATDSFSTIDIQVGQNTSIAYSTDGELYAVTSADETGEGFATYVVNTQTGSATAINSTESAIEEPISDISRGPIM